MLSKIKKLFMKESIKPDKPNKPIPRHPPNWRPKEFVLKKDLPNVTKGAIFQQSYQSDNIYFYGIPISSKLPKSDQVGIVEFEAENVENNPKWFMAK